LGAIACRHEPLLPAAIARRRASQPDQLGLDDDFSLWKPQFGWWLNKRERVVKKLGMRGSC
jgi:hypothetical protein